MTRGWTPTVERHTQGQCSGNASAQHGGRVRRLSESRLGSNSRTVYSAVARGPPWASSRRAHPVSASLALRTAQISGTGMYHPRRVVSVHVEIV